MRLKEIWLDPTTEETSDAKGCLMLACVPALNLLTNIWQTGQMSVDEMEQVLLFPIHNFLLYLLFFDTSVYGYLPRTMCRYSFRGLSSSSRAVL